MLIKIDKSLVIEEGYQNTRSEEIIIALETLASARREGKHAVIAQRETLKKISECLDLSKPARDIYHKAYNHFPQFNAYLNAVTKYVEVINPCLIPQVSSHSGKQVIQVPPSFFNDSETAQKTILLCENANDAVLYETIAKVYLVWKNLKIPLACEHRGGGGSTIATEYSNIQKPQKRFCLCIIDSDKIAPNGNLGSTAKLVQEQYNSGSITTQLVILNVREIENLIPTSILSELVSGDRKRQNALSLLEKIQTSSVSDAKAFLDLKKGLSLKDIVRIESDLVKSFWKTKITQIHDLTNGIDSWCKDNWQCSNTKKCNCCISLGFGENLLDNTVSWLEYKTPHKIAEMVDQSLRLEWEQIGEAIVNWCFSEKPIRA